MPIIHHSRTGKTYYLQTGPKRSGGVQHFFSSKPTGPLAERVPDGFEVYENVRGLVFLRREQPKLVRDEELEGLRRRLDRAPAGHRYKLEVRGRIITIHESSDNFGRLGEFALRLSFREQERIAERHACYQAVLRFSLVDEARRLFAPERFCFRGSVDDWIPLGSPETLEKLAAKYLKHLGHDSFYELY